MSLSQNLKKLRLSHHLSQVEITKHFCISRSAYSFWKKDITYPKRDNLEKLAKLFQVDVADLTQDSRAILLNIYDTWQDKVIAYSKQ